MCEGELWACDANEKLKQKQNQNHGSVTQRSFSQRFTYKDGELILPHLLFKQPVGYVMSHGDEFIITWLHVGSVASECMHR